MRRVLLLITDLEIGGTPTVVRELAVRLNRQGRVEVGVACLAGWGPVAEEIRRGGAEVTALGARGARDVGVVYRLVRLIRERGFDTVFSFLIHANAAAAAASVVCRGVRYLQSIQTTQPKPRWHWWMQRVVQEAAERIVVPSRSVAEAAVDWAGVPREKIVIVPNAVEAGEFSLLGIDGRNAPGQAGRVEGEPVPIGFIGRLDPIKRLPDLLEAVKLLQGRVHLHVYGEGRDRRRLEGLVRELDIAAWVTLQGAVSAPQQALRQVELLVLPSEAEGFGLVLIEAMAAGVPVVATNVPGIRDVVRHGETGVLVPVRAPLALADAIRRVIEDEPLRNRLVNSASQEVRARFAWESVLPQYVQLLE